MSAPSSPLKHSPQDHTVADSESDDDSQATSRVGSSRGGRSWAILPALVMLAIAAVYFAPREALSKEGTDGVMEKAVVEEPEFCAKETEDCSASKCCTDSTMQCFAKNENFATCMVGCVPGIHEGDSDSEPWSCAWLWSPEGVKQDWGVSETFAWEKVGTLSNEGKASLLSGTTGGKGYAGFVNAQSFIWDAQAALTMNDGPQGYNGYQERLAGTSTQFPCLLAVAASFDAEISRRYAVAVAEEFVAKASNVMLGPDVEVTRAALSGRSFETISGEDPFLGSTLVQPFVRAVQGLGIIATVKHWLDNNQEIYRQSMNVEVGDRAQHEIYMPVFKAAFDAGAGAVMCAYNKVYGTFACENERILKKLLREELGFKGYVVSDWGATHDGEKSVRAGLDIEMPKGDHINDVLGQLESDPDLQKMFDQMAVHVVSAMHYVGQFDGRFPVKGWLPAGQMENDGTSDDHRGVALQTIVDSAVLLRNEDETLPVETAGKTIAMIGKTCDAIKDDAYKQGSVWAGGGSGYVATTKGTTPLASVKEQITDAEVKWSADGSAAEGADVAVICVAAHGEEGWDRSNFSLPEVDWLISDVRKRSSSVKVVVIAAVPGAVATEWVEKTDAAMVLFMPGEQVGPAIVKLLTGEASPGGRLPISFPMANETRFTQKQYPGWCDDVDGGWCEHMTANFSEGVLIGYRWNDAKSVPSAFPFGYGLTYTEFKFHSFHAAYLSNGDVKVTFKIRNIGKRTAAALPQLYVGFKSLLPVVRQLRGFQKVQLEPGHQSTVSFDLSTEDWSFYDEADGRWASAMEKGEHITVSVGASSADLKWHKDIVLKEVN